MPHSIGRGSRPGNQFLLRREDALGASRGESNLRAADHQRCAVVRVEHLGIDVEHAAAGAPDASTSDGVPHAASAPSASSASREQVRAASVRSWETTSAAPPWAANSRTRSSTTAAVAQVEMAVGLVEQQHFGSGASARATSTSCRYTARELEHRAVGQRLDPTCARQARARSTSAGLSKPRPVWCGARPISTTSPARNANGTATSWGTTARSARELTARERLDRRFRRSTPRRARVAARASRRETRVVFPGTVWSASPSTSPAAIRRTPRAARRVRRAAALFLEAERRAVTAQSSAAVAAQQIQRAAHRRARMIAPTGNSRPSKDRRAAGRTARGTARRRRAQPRAQQAVVGPGRSRTGAGRSARRSRSHPPRPPPRRPSRRREQEHPLEPTTSTPSCAPILHRGASSSGRATAAARSRGPARGRADHRGRVGTHGRQASDQPQEELVPQWPGERRTNTIAPKRTR